MWRWLPAVIVDVRETAEKVVPRSGRARYSEAQGSRMQFPLRINLVLKEARARKKAGDHMMPSTTKTTRVLSMMGQRCGLERGTRSDLNVHPARMSIGAASPFSEAFSSPVEFPQLYGQESGR
jgi:hypothetical protein